MERKPRLSEETQNWIMGRSGETSWLTFSFFSPQVVLVCALSLGAGLVDRSVGKGSPVRVARHWQSWGWGQNCLAQSAELTLHPNQATGGGRWVLIPLQLLIQLPMLAGPQTPALPSPP